MSYLVYQLSDGYVVGIYDSMPASIPDGHAVAQCDGYAPGDEFKYYIIVHVEDGIITSVSAVQQAPPATYLMQRLAEKEAEIEELKQLVADLANLQLGV